jgi:LysR substrate binding domain
MLTGRSLHGSWKRGGGANPPHWQWCQCRGSGCYSGTCSYEGRDPFRECRVEVRDRVLIDLPRYRGRVVFVSPVGSDLPGTVSWNDIVTQRLVLPPAGSGRRQLIDDTAASTSGKTPRASLVTDERTSWLAAAQSGNASFLSYRPVVDRIDDIEVRPLEPPSTVSVGFVHRAGPMSSAATELIALERSSFAT